MFTERTASLLVRESGRAAVRALAVERLAAALGLCAGRQVDDRLLFCDRLRKLALDSLGTEDLGSLHEQVRDELERLLAELENLAAKPWPADRP